MLQQTSWRASWNIRIQFDVIQWLSIDGDQNQGLEMHYDMNNLNRMQCNFSSCQFAQIVGYQFLYGKYIKLNK